MDGKEDPENKSSISTSTDIAQTTVENRVNLLQQGGYLRTEEISLDHNIRTKIYSTPPGTQVLREYEAHMKAMDGEEDNESDAYEIVDAQKQLTDFGQYILEATEETFETLHAFILHLSEKKE